MKLHLRLYKYSINIHSIWENELIQRLRVSTVTPCDNGVNWLTSKHRQNLFYSQRYFRQTVICRRQISYFLYSLNGSMSKEIPLTCHPVNIVTHDNSILFLEENGSTLHFWDFNFCLAVFLFLLYVCVVYSISSPYYSFTYLACIL